MVTPAKPLDLYRAIINPYLTERNLAIATVSTVCFLFITYQFCKATPKVSVTPGSGSSSGSPNAEKNRSDQPPPPPPPRSRQATPHRRPFPSDLLAALRQLVPPTPLPRDDLGVGTPPTVPPRGRTTTPTSSPKHDDDDPPLEPVVLFSEPGSDTVPSDGLDELIEDPDGQVLLSAALLEEEPANEDTPDTDLWAVITKFKEPLTESLSTCTEELSDHLALLTPKKAKPQAEDYAAIIAYVKDNIGDIETEWKDLVIELSKTVGKEAVLGILKSFVSVEELLSYLKQYSGKKKKQMTRVKALQLFLETRLVIGLPDPTHLEELVQKEPQSIRGTPIRKRPKLPFGTPQLRVAIHARRFRDEVAARKAALTKLRALVNLDQDEADGSDEDLGTGEG